MPPIGKAIGNNLPNLFLGKRYAPSNSLHLKLPWQSFLPERAFTTVPLVSYLIRLHPRTTLFQKRRLTRQLPGIGATFFRSAWIFLFCSFLSPAHEQTVINFFIVALILFSLVLLYNKSTLLKKKVGLIKSIFAVWL